MSAGQPLPDGSRWFVQRVAWLNKKAAAKQALGMPWAVAWPRLASRSRSLLQFHAQLYGLVVAEIKTHIHAFHFLYFKIGWEQKEIYHRGESFGRVKSRFVFAVGGHRRVVSVGPIAKKVGVVVL